jgi:hypothetical protein
MPVPIVLGWTLALSINGKILDTEHLYEMGTLIALSFAILALSVVVFVRVKQRWLKLWVLIIPELLVLAMVVFSSSDSINFIGWLLLSALAVIFILGPALLERTSKSIEEHRKYRSIG